MWRLAAATARGRSHERANLPCQDACGAILTDSGVIAALADGAGSAARARDGAELAVATALDYLSEDDDDWSSQVRGLLTTLRLRLGREASVHGCALRDYHCTLQVVRADDRGWHAAQVGDGFIVYHDDQGLHTVSAPERSGYVNETRFVTEADAPLRLCSLPRWPRFWCCSSDGLERLALQGDSPFPGFFQPLERFLLGQADRAQADTELATWLSSDTIRNRSDDDCSLILAAQEQT